MAEKITLLNQLRAASLKSKAFILAKISELSEAIVAALDEKEDKPIEFRVINDNGYTVVEAPATFGELIPIYFTKARASLTVVDSGGDVEYYADEYNIYMLSNTSAVMAFYRNDLVLTNGALERPKFVGVALIASWQSTSADAAVSWSYLLKQDMVSALTSDIPTNYAGAAAQGGAANKAASIPFAQVDSTSTSTAFTATVDGITELRDGVCCYLRNGVVTSAEGCTLNVNGLGAKPLYSSLAASSRSTTIFNVNYAMLFVYNSTRVSGGCWDVFYGYDSNTNTIGYQLRTNSTTMPMSEITYRYRLLFTSADGTKFVPANTSTSTNATASRAVNQTKIDPFGRIAYYGTTASVAAGSRPSASYLWDQYVITLGYSFNRTGAALVLTTYKPVYIKCAPQTDGSAIIDATTPYVQALPSTADGNIYIYLGVAASATTVEVSNNHPVYCYRNGRIQQWTGVQAEIDSILTTLNNLDILDEEAF